MTAKHRFTYNDLLHSDGTPNLAAFTQILDSRVRAEIASRLCVAANLWAPKSVPLGDLRAWHAAQVKLHGLGPLSNEEVARITRQERDALDSWVQTMQVAARRQKRAMDDAFEMAS